MCTFVFVNVPSTQSLCVFSLYFVIVPSTLRMCTYFRHCSFYTKCICTYFIFVTVPSSLSTYICTYFIFITVPSTLSVCVLILFL